MSTSEENQELIIKIKDLIDDLVRKNPESNGLGVYLKSKKFNLDFGYSIGITGNLDWQAPVNIASVTKMYVAVAIMKLVELDKLSLDKPISEFLDAGMINKLRNASFVPDEIKILHLLSNTSGIPDYVDTPFFQQRTTQSPSYSWTHEEQILLALTNSANRFQPGERFEFSETNYLLLTLIIERCYKQPFHLAIRELLDFGSKNLNNTWFILQETKPVHTHDFHLQTAKSLGVESHRLHPSFDAFGGGGMASTVEDMSKFGYELLNGGILKNPDGLKLMLVEPATLDGKKNHYGLGLMKSSLEEEISFGHGGFWGTHLRIFPNFDLSIGVFVLERDAWMVYKTFFQQLSELLNEHQKTI
jgi:D-alanyl-D-alanine carboxypeptidase